MKISLLPPTRGRPYNMERFLISFFDTAASPNDLEIVWYIDEDDTDSQDQFYEQRIVYADKVKAVIGPRITMSQMHNEAYKVATGEILGFFGDDVISRSYGWDTLVRAEFGRFSDRCCLVYGDDTINHGSLGTHAFVHRRAVEVLGYVTPPYYTAFFGDTHVNEIYHNLGRRIYLPNVVHEHMHPSVGKGSEDQTTKEMYARNRKDNNDALWYEKLPHRMEETKKLLEYINQVNGTKLHLHKYERIL